MSASARPGLTRRAWHTRAALPMVGWMLALVLLVGAHRFIPRSVWLLVHLVTLGVASNAIVVWSNHFADAVLRSRPRGHRREVAELVLLNAGLLALCVGVVGQWAVPVWLGAALVVALAATAVVALARQARASLAARFGFTVRWYQAAACCLAAGGILGALMAVPYGRWSDELLVAHLAFNALGWLGLTVWGTLTTLWPTLLRTRADKGTERGARRALPLMVAGLLVVAGCVVLPGGWWRAAGALGVAGYLAGVVLQLGPIVRVWRASRASSFPALSVGLGQAWFVGWLVWLGWRMALSGSPAVLVDSLRPSVPLLLVGFLLQVVLGALAYLLPVVLGGGPAMVRSTTAVFERGAVARLGVTNLGLAVFLAPIPSVWKVTSSTTVFVALAAFLVLVVRAWWLRRREPSLQAAGAQAEPDHRRRLRRGMAWALAWTLLAAGLAAAIDPASFRALARQRPAATVAATGHTTTVQVVAQGMRFVPDTVQVPVGDRLVVQLRNADAGQVHDLVLADGSTSGRVSPGGQGSLVDEVVSGSLEGWCSVAGHRQMGMVFHVQVTGAAASSAATPGPAGQGSAERPTLDQSRPVGAGWSARDPRLPAASPERVHRVRLEVRDTVVEVSPGVRQTLWTFNGTAPGPVLRGRLGDVFEVTLVNHASMGHSIDFHAGALAPDEPMRTIAPGQSLLYRFTAERAGVWMYHCSTAPMSLHIANGMYGAVVIDPPDLPPFSREYLLVQGEQYYGAPGPDGTPGVADATRISAEQPDAVVFNGFPGQYDRSPLAARVGERVRFWVLDAGPQRSLAFHVVGAQFSSVWQEGHWVLRDGRTPGVAGSTQGGSQSLALLASQGGFVETTFSQAGHYPFVNHQMVDAERGAHGIVLVSP